MSQYGLHQPPGPHGAFNQAPGPHGGFNQQLGAPGGFHHAPSSQGNINQQPGPLGTMNQPPGPQGNFHQPPGPQGSNLPPGPQGFNQHPGPQGSNLPPGPQGFNQQSGPPGAFHHPPGPQGFNPPSASQGSNQPPGPQGNFHQPPGPQGSNLPPGPQGFNQHPGPQGSNLPPGPQGFNQPPGPPGAFHPPPGPQGSNLPPGPQGFNQQPGLPGAYNQPPGPPGAYNQPPGPPGAFNQPPGPPGAYNQQTPAYNQPLGPPGGYTQHPGPPGGYGQLNAYPPAQQKALTLSSLPSAVQVFEDDKQTRSGAFPTGFPTAEYPPFSNTDFYAQDNGNCSPKFMRSSLYCVPQNNDILKNTGIPFAVSMTPFAKVSVNEYNTPVVDLGEMGPIRCQRCKAYICPFMEFIDGGRKFRCPFCHAPSQIEEGYFAHLDHTGRRTDIQHRPELCFGSYEFVATKLYCKNGIPPKQPAFVFMLDVSYNSVKNGLVSLFCKNLPEILRSLPKDHNQDRSTMRIGFATYDQSIHFYNLNNPTRPEMMVVNDVTDVFVPLIEGFFVDFDAAEELLKRCLLNVKDMFAETRITEPMLGPAVKAGIEALKAADCAGKVFVFHSSIPTFDAPGRLKNREDRKVLGTDKEKTQLTPAVDYYTKLGEECIKVGCSVDLFLFPNANVDLASMASVCTVSGGGVYKYQYFDADRDGERFLQDLFHNVSRPIAFDCMMRVRTSTGIRPTGFFGNFFMQNTTDIEVGTLDSDKGMSIEIKYDDKLDEQAPAVIQTAVLFTSVSGQRRLRIHNLCLGVSADYQFIYRYADNDAVVDHLFKYAARNVKEKAPKELREDLSRKCAQILATYREKCSSHSPLSQLVLPESLKLLPLFVSCILRNDAIGGGSEMTVDDRAWLLSMVPSMRVDLSVRGLYPQLLPLKSMTENVGESSAPYSLPAPARASYEFLDAQDVYLIENGMIGFLWIGHGAPQEFINDVFNVPSLQHLNTESHDIPVRDNPNNKALHALLENTNKNRPLHLKVMMIKQQDSLESWMKKFLVEDKYATGTLSYVEFLCEVHREIRTILS